MTYQGFLTSTFQLFQNVLSNLKHACVLPVGFLNSALSFRKIVVFLPTAGTRGCKLNVLSGSGCSMARGEDLDAAGSRLLLMEMTLRYCTAYRVHSLFSTGSQLN
jgi:hypothetical protein